MELRVLDWVVIAAYFIFNLAIGLYYRRRATGSTDAYFAGDRKVGWFLAGTSMVATTFADDTPLAVTGLVAKHGIAGNWLWWNLLLSGMLTVFFFARLWRRAGVLTDVEFAEIRYAGRPAAFLRGFRAVYLGLPINCIILGWVNLAMVKILMVIFPALDKLHALGLVFCIILLTAGISTLSGLWGVLVTDLFQFVLKMGMVIVLAYDSVKAAGGMGGMVARLRAMDAARDGGSILDFVPAMDSAWMPLLTVFVYIAVTWWATWYPGSEPGGGGYVAQRIFCAKDERNSLLATLWFAIAHYAIRPWPWILTALASLVLYPTLADKESGYIKLLMDPGVFPPALRGVMIAAFAAAYMSTVATQLNWGASYLVSDVYRRFLNPGREDRHYVRAGQAATLLLMVASCVVTWFQTDIEGAWKLLMAIGAGTGSVLILRWFWWRINAWSEITAMAASFLSSMALQHVFRFDAGDPRELAIQILISVGVSTAAWLGVTLLTGPEPDAVLRAFYRRVRPSALMWGPVARACADVVPRNDLATAFLDWLAGCVMVYMALFGVGKCLFGAWGPGLGFLGVAAVCGGFLHWHLRLQEGS